MNQRNSETFKKKRPSERGGILITAIMVILVMLILAIPFLVKLSGQSRSTERASKALAALNLAEAGVDKVMWTLDPLTSPSLTDPERIVWEHPGVSSAIALIPPAATPQAFVKTSDGRDLGFIQVVLTDPVGVAPNPQTRLLDSTGRVPFIADRTVDRTVRVKLMRYYKSIFDVGFFVDEYFYIRNSFFLDAYDSRNGAYGAALSGGGTNSLLTDAIFASNSYIVDSGTGQENAGDASWIIGQGGGSNEVYGTVMAGGDAAEAYNNGTATNPPDASVLEDVISVPSESAFMGESDRMVMSQEYELPPVDVYNLPPKEMLGELPSVGEWFNNYNATTPESSTGYYADRLNRAPLQSEIVPAYAKGTFSTAVNGNSLTPANNGIYTSFRIGDYGQSGTVNISGGDVVLYVTGYDGNPAASFYMGKDSNINIAEGSSLTLILGNASMTAEQGYSINAVGNPAQAADCVILGTNQFAVPANKDISNLGNPKAPNVDKMQIPGLMFFEHGQGGDPNGRIYAATYVPSASLTTGQGQNHMDYYGALITKTMEFKVQVDFHYDKALADLKIIEGGFEYWKIVNWVELVGN